MAGLVDFTNAEEAEEYLNNIEIEYMFGCHKEHKADSCYRLGEFLDSMHKNFVEAFQIYKMCCDKWENAPCCYKAGTYYQLGRGEQEKSEVKAYEYYKIACDQNLYTEQGKNDRIAAACVDKALLLNNNESVKSMFLEKFLPDGTISDSKKASCLLHSEILKCYTKACNLNDPAGCYQLSLLYLTGFSNIPQSKDQKLSAKYAEKSCDLGQFQACHNLSLMYKRGDGVKKDITKSIEYAKLRDQLLYSNDSLKFGES